MLSFDDLLQLVKPHCTEEPVADALSTPPAIKLAAADLLPVCRVLHENEQTFFDMLSCVTGIDNGVEANAMEMVYHLYSIPFDHRLTLKVLLPRDNAEIVSVSSIWKTADWHERETYDLLGIRFSAHPDLRRILLPADWIGHPLRKDYKPQEYYHGIQYNY